MDRRLVALLLFAVLVRVAAVFALQSHRVPASTYEHGEIAASLVSGRGFSMHFLGAEGPTSQQAPAYPFLLAAAYAIAGVETPGSLLILQLAQAALAGVMVLGVFRLASWVAPDRPAVAWWGAAVAAFHPTLVYAATHVQVALLAATLVVWSLLWGVRAGMTGSRRAAAATGLLLALCALTDPILALVGAGVLIAFRIAGEGRPAWRPTLVALGVAALVVAPWTARNAMVHGEFVPIKSTFGYAFWQGNCAVSQGTDKVVRGSVEGAMEEANGSAGLAEYNRGLWKARHTAGYIDDVAFSPEFKHFLGTLPEAERSRVLLRMATADIQADPARYAGLCLRRLRYFWLFDETNPKTRDPIYRASHLGLSGLALLGLATAGAGFRRRSIPLLATVAALAAFHALTIVSARFHVPIEPLMAVWAGAGVMWIVEAASRAFRSRSASMIAMDRVEHVGVVGGRLG